VGKYGPAQNVPLPDDEAKPMKMINQSYRSFSMLVEVNLDRFLVPLTIIGALTVAGWLVSL
jgi:hypothetical protein